MQCNTKFLIGKFGLRSSLPSEDVLDGVDQLRDRGDAAGPVDVRGRHELSSGLADEEWSGCSARPTGAG